MKSQSGLRGPELGRILDPVCEGERGTSLRLLFQTCGVILPLPIAEHPDDVRTRGLKSEERLEFKVQLCHIPGILNELPSVPESQCSHL